LSERNTIEQACANFIFPIVLKSGKENTVTIRSPEMAIFVQSDETAIKNAGLVITLSSVMSMLLPPRKALKVSTPSVTFIYVRRISVFISYATFHVQPNT
jgi:hypothetical protein